MADSELKVLRLVAARPKTEELGPFPAGTAVRMKGDRNNPQMTVQTPGPEWTQCTWFDESLSRVGPELFRNSTLELWRPPRKKRRAPRKALEVSVEAPPLRGARPKK